MTVFFSYRQTKYIYKIKAVLPCKRRNKKKSSFEFEKNDNEKKSKTK